jgi:hypothetical protein
MVPALVPVRDTVGAVQWREVGLTHDDGTPLCLCDTPIDTFKKADETLLPQLLEQTNQYRYDIQAARPYAAGPAEAARMVFRANNGSKTAWDTTAWTGLTAGAYTSNGMSNPQAVFLTGVTGAADAAAYGLLTAALQAPNQPGVYTRADQAGMAAALAAQTPTGVGGVTVTDPAELPADAYPLTSVLWAAVNLTVTDADARSQFADLIEHAVTNGQEPGRSLGQLPDGYLPLSDQLRQQALTTAGVIRDRGQADQPTPDPTPSPDLTPPGDSGGAPGGTSVNSAPIGPAQGSPVSSGNTGLVDDTVTPTIDTEPPTAYTQSDAVEAKTTAAAQPPARSALGGGLAAGLAGLVIGPLLMRRREVRP